MKTKAWLHFASALAVLAALVGCATQYVHQRHEAQFLPDPIDSNFPAACHVVITQNDPFVAAKTTLPWAQGQYVAASPTLVGAAVDLAVTFVLNEALKEENNVANEIRREQAAKRSAPLQGHGMGRLFTDEFQSSLSGALNSSPWLHAMPLEMSRDDREVPLAELMQHPVLQIRTIYHLSYDASILIMQAHVIYFHQGETNAEHARFYTYFSEPVGSEKDEAAVAKWISADNELLRRRMNEGINEVIAMLNADFLRPEWRDPTIPNVTIACWDALNQEQVRLEGHVLRKGSPRVLLQEKGGDLLSVIPQ